MTFTSSFSRLRRLMPASLIDGLMTAEQIADLAKKEAPQKIPQLVAPGAGHRVD